jgi:hypothetical protein
VDMPWRSGALRLLRLVWRFAILVPDDSSSREHYSSSAKLD